MKTIKDENYIADRLAKEALRRKGMGVLLDVFPNYLSLHPDCQMMEDWK